MSLLLEALKKAELAKQSSTDVDPAAQEPPRERIITRENLPDITQQLEILSEDLPSARRYAASKSSPELQLAVDPVQARPAADDPAPDVPPAQQQAAARQLFEVKELENYNPRRPFYYTLGALGVFAVGTVVYFWWQLQPHYNVIQQAVANAPVKPIATPAVAPPAAQPAIPSPTAADGSAPMAQAPVMPAQPPALRARAPRPSETTSPGTSRAVPMAAGRGDSITSRTPITITPATVQSDPLLERAYEAYQGGNFATARESYQQVLKADPANRDALLGMAAIEVRSAQFESAEARYLRLLESDPRDAHAQAGLIALRGQANPSQSESRLKTLIAGQPEVSSLHFALGNQMAMQARWAEAQQAYFKAYSIEPNNPDYAYNLAVSLDQMHQGKPALEYYQKALALAATRPAGFDRGLAAVRVGELQK